MRDEAVGSALGLLALLVVALAVLAMLYAAEGGRCDRACSSEVQPAECVKRCEERLDACMTEVP